MLAALLLAAALAAPVQDPVRVTASLTRDRVAVGEATTLQVSADTRGAAVDEMGMPALPPELEILGTSDFSQTQISMPGGRTRLTRRDILLSPRAPGVYRIPPVRVRVGGETYETQPLTLIVTAGSAYGGSPRVGIGGGRSTSGLTIRLTPDTVFVGQQVMLEAEVTFADEYRTRSSRPASFEPPAPSGFWVQDLPDPVTVSLRVAEGRTVESQTYRRAYFPLSAGSYSFPPAHLYYDMRRGFLNAPENRKLSSDSARIVVRPLPREGQPAGFRGAVGRLEMSASVRPERIAAGEAAVVEVEVRGSGNVKGLPEPALPALDGVEVFPPNQESSVEITGQRVGGVKRFRWVVVPAEAGTLVIPPISYSYFDPELRQYVTLESEPLQIVAEPNLDGVAAAPSDTAVRPLRATPGRPTAAWTRTPLFAALQVVPLLLVGAVGIVRRRRTRPPQPADHARRLRRELDTLRQRPGDAAALHELERLLHDAVRCLTPVAGVDTVAGLRALGRTSEADTLDGLLRRLQHARYAPHRGPVEMGGFIADAERFLDALLPARGWRRRRSTAAGGALLVVAVAAGALALALPLHSASRAEPSAAPRAEPFDASRAEPFDAAVESFRAGDFAAAGNGFHAYARSRPDDPNGWYNAGVAAWHAGDRGRAVWAWLRAVRIAPRDADLQHNLALAGAAGAAAQVRPVDRLANGERILLAAVGWWLLVFGAAAWRSSGAAAGGAAAGRGAAGRDAAGRAAAGRDAAGRDAGRAAVLAAAAVLLLVMAGSIASGIRPLRVTPLGNGTGFYAGPTARDQQLGELQVGTLARVLERRDDWLLVAAAPGVQGWVHRVSVAAP